MTLDGQAVRVPAARTYGQYCGVARALDLVGDRWTLLIARELLVRGACRYTDLQRGLPGIATNLLADRLRDLEASGIVTRELAPPPVATTLVRLTEWGESLRPIVHALGRWGGPLLADGLAGSSFRSHWLIVLVEASLRDRKPDRGAATIEIRTGDEPVTLEVDGRVRATMGRAERPDAVLAGPPDAVIALLLGRTDLAAAEPAGVVYEGDPKLLRRIRP